jgi:hypothetical protein
MIAEHMARVQAESDSGSTDAPLDFEAQYRAHMSELGKKGGDISGERRMSLPVEVRRRVASIAARAMWAKRKGAKKR